MNSPLVPALDTGHLPAPSAAVTQDDVTFLLTSTECLTIDRQGIFLGKEHLATEDVTALTWGIQYSTTRGDLRRRDFSFTFEGADRSLSVRWEANDTLRAWLKLLFHLSADEMPVATRGLEEQVLAYEKIVSALRRFIVPSWVHRVRETFAQGGAITIGEATFNAYGAHFSADQNGEPRAVNLPWALMAVRSDGLNVTVSAMHDDARAISFPLQGTPNAAVLVDLWMEMVQLG